jgi:hypothetical protein
MEERCLYHFTSDKFSFDDSFALSSWICERNDVEVVTCSFEDDGTGTALVSATAEAINDLKVCFKWADNASLTLWNSFNLTIERDYSLIIKALISKKIRQQNAGQGT